MPRGLVAMGRSGGHCPLRVSGGILCSERGQSRDAFQAIRLEETSPRCNNKLYDLFCAWSDFDIQTGKQKHQHLCTKILSIFYNFCILKIHLSQHTCQVRKVQKREISLFASYQRRRFFRETVLQHLSCHRTFKFKLNVLILGYVPSF